MLKNVRKPSSHGFYFIKDFGQFLLAVIAAFWVRLSPFFIYTLKLKNSVFILETVKFFATSNKKVVFFREMLLKINGDSYMNYVLKRLKKII
jgi:hypothetical protein